MNKSERKHEIHHMIHVVDDEGAIRDLLLEMLQYFGFEAQAFDSAESYLAAMQQGDYTMPGVLLSDIDMPGMNGLQLIAKVQLQHPAICYMLMTGNPDQCTEKRLHQHGLAGHIKHVFAKPFSPSYLQNVLENVTDF